jgi:hypothetical protein
VRNQGLKELDLAVLRRDLPLHHLMAGDIGTVVFVHNGGRAYEVEFMAADGRTIAVETLDADALEALSGEQILHVRKLAPA